MKVLRAVSILCFLLCSWSSLAFAEGFALTEWSARGLSLAGGLVGRADDPSAIAYNAAGITQLPGTQIMGGFALIAPTGTVDTQIGQGQNSSWKSTSTTPRMWPAPHGYITHQLNDRIWLGLGAFSRFGLGNEYDDQWVGRYNIVNVGLQTFSLVPTIAYKLNDILSLSLGLEVMHGSISMKNQIPTMNMGAHGLQMFDNAMKLQGSGWGAGAHLGAHFRMNDQWSLGLTYKSQVAMTIRGDVDFNRQGSNILADMGQVPHAINTNAHSTIHLPDSFALALAYKPLENLSFEVGTVWTRWSSFKSLDIYFDSGYDAISPKEWRDGWNFNASVEYKPIDWLALRAGFWHETPVINKRHADFMVPSAGRSVLTLGAGIAYEDWTFDVGYAHLWINSLDYGSTDASGIHVPANISGGYSKNTVANIYTASIGYKF